MVQSSLGGTDQHNYYTYLLEALNPYNAYVVHITYALRRAWYSCGMHLKRNSVQASSSSQDFRRERL